MTSQKEPIITSITRKPGLGSKYEETSSVSSSASRNSFLVYLRRYEAMGKYSNAFWPCALLEPMKRAISRNSGESAGTRVSTHLVPWIAFRPIDLVALGKRDSKNATNSPWPSVSDTLRAQIFSHRCSLYPRQFAVLRLQPLHR